MSLNKSETAHRTAGLVYCLWMLGVLFGVTAVIGVIINHTKLKSVKGTHAHSHFIWQITSFWLVFAGVVACLVFWPGEMAQMIAVGCVFIWLFSGLIGSWQLARSRQLNSFGRKNRPVRRPHHVEDDEIYDDTHNDNAEQPQ